jgi:glycosyltransferase involved in cell wall biosynthesis
MYAAAARTVRAFAPDVVHAHWWLPGGWIASRLDVPFVVTCHGSDVRLLDRSALVRRIARSVFARAGAVTSVSDFLANDLRAIFPAAATKVRALAMPVDVGHFAAGRCVPKHDPPRILYAGNLVATKGVSVLIDAFDLLRARGVACELRILGEGPERDAVRAQARRLGLEHDISWSDFVPQDVMPTEYGRSTVAVLPSRGQQEGLGLTLVEALLAGCAVVGTRAGGIPEVVVHERTGLLARGGDAADLAAQLERILTDPELRARTMAEGRAAVEDRFETGRAAARFLALYRELA